MQKRRSCVDSFCCCALRQGVRAAAIAYSVVFGVWVLFALFIISVNRNEEGGSIHTLPNMNVRFYGSVVPRFVTFWIASCKNGKKRVHTGTRWCLAFVYVITLIVGVINEFWAVASWFEMDIGTNKGFLGDMERGATKFFRTWAFFLSSLAAGLDIYFTVCVWSWAQRGSSDEKVIEHNKTVDS